MPKQPFATFEKKAAGFSGFGTIPFGGRRNKNSPFRESELRLPDLETQEFETNLYKLGDQALAKRVTNLKKQYPDGTLPEMVTMDWLEKSGIRYFYQSVYGKYGKRGLKLPDFVVDQNGQGLVWEIDGEYFHTKRKTPETDRLRDAQLLNRVINGVSIRKVVHLRENDIYTKRPQVFLMALAGIGVSTASSRRS